MRTFLLAFVCLFGIPTTEAIGQITVHSSLENDYEVRPGQTSRGIISIRNGGDAPREVVLYQQDAVYRPGGTDFREPGSTERSNARWITFTPERLTLLPRQVVSVEYTISVPDSGSLRGTYWSIIMVENLVARPAEKDETDGRPAVRLGLKFRYAVQIAAHIAGTGEFMAAIEESRVDTSQGASAFALKLKNEGDRMARPSVWLELYDDEGALAGKFEGENVRLYPGSSSFQRIAFSEPLSGRYKALLLIDGGPGALFAAQYDLEL